MMTDEQKRQAKAIVQGLALDAARELGARTVIADWEIRTDGSIDGLQLVVTMDGPTYTTRFAQTEFAACLADEGARQRVHGWLRDQFDQLVQP